MKKREPVEWNCGFVYNNPKEVTYMKKYIAILVVLTFALLLSGCRKDVVLKEMKEYNVGSDVRSLEIRINAAELTIEEAKDFSVESNLKYLTVSERNGVLSLVEDVKNAGKYNDAVLTLYVPAGTVFDAVRIKTGAGRLTADELAAESLDLELGAGEVRIGRLEASREADIEGGAGAVVISDGTLRDLDLEMGVGELSLTAALMGDCDLSFGVGESNLTLLGSKDDYRVDMEKGIGGITVDGETFAGDKVIGTGANHVDIEGGVGAINLKFR